MTRKLAFVSSSMANVATAFVGKPDDGGRDVSVHITAKRTGGPGKNLNEGRRSVSTWSRTRRAAAPRPKPLHDWLADPATGSSRAWLIAASGQALRVGQATGRAIHRAPVARNNIAMMILFRPGFCLSPAKSVSRRTCWSCFLDRRPVDLEDLANSVSACKTCSANPGVCRGRGNVALRPG
jgi:cold shock CspA family protein